MSTPTSASQVASAVDRLPDGSVVHIVGTAGSGKTRMLLDLARRRCAPISAPTAEAAGDAAPPSALFLTFTNEAVRELRRRSSAASISSTICTLHSMAMRVFVALDSDDAPIPSPDHVFAAALALLSRTTDFAALRRALLLENLRGVYGDEAQDMSAPQHDFVDALHKVVWPRAHLVLVGDPRQSIYAFAGAAPDRFLDHPSATWLRMDLCFRSTQRLVRFANMLARSMNQPLILPGRDEPGEPPLVLRFPDQSAELRWVARNIEHLVRSGESPGDIAVLSRKHAYTRCTLFDMLIASELDIDVCTLRDHADEDTLSEGESAAAQSAPCVTLGTIHASKGDEWKYVFIVGCTDAECLDTFFEDVVQERVEEELRVLFVGATRAVDRLCITYAEHKFPQRWGGGAAEAATTLTRFVEAATDKVEYTSWGGHEPVHSPDAPTWQPGVDGCGDSDSPLGEGEEGDDLAPEPVRRRSISFSPWLPRSAIDALDAAQRDPATAAVRDGFSPTERVANPLTVPPLIRRHRLREDFLSCVVLIAADELYALGGVGGPGRFGALAPQLLLPGVSFATRAEMEAMPAVDARKCAEAALDASAPAPPTFARSLKRKLKAVEKARGSAKRRGSAADSWRDIVQMIPREQPLWRPSREAWDWSLGDGLSGGLLRDIHQAFDRVRGCGPAKRTSLRDLVLLALLFGVARDDADARLLMRVSASYNGRTGPGVVSVDALVDAFSECEGMVRSRTNALVARMYAETSISRVLEWDDDEARVGDDAAVKGIALADLGGTRVYVSSGEPAAIVGERPSSQRVSTKTGCVALLSSVTCPLQSAVFEIDTGLLQSSYVRIGPDDAIAVREAIDRHWTGRHELAN